MFDILFVKINLFKFHLRVQEFNKDTTAGRFFA